MSNRLTQKMTDIRKQKGKIFCGFITLGYPSLKATETLALQMEKEGVDILELGIPFSDPLADGPTIQKSSDDALRRGVSLVDGFKMVRKLRDAGLTIPVICFCYLNPIYRFGLKKFPVVAKEAGFDGVLIPDLSIEEEVPFQDDCRQLDLSTVFLITPTTALKRAKKIAARSQGFIYYVSLRGVTGARSKISSRVKSELSRFQKVVHKPFLIGFGIGTPEDSRRMSQISEGVIVGSAIINKIRPGSHQTNSAIKFIRSMVQAAKGKA